MRALLVALTLLLAGCTTPGDDATPAPGPDDGNTGPDGTPNGKGGAPTNNTDDPFPGATPVSGANSTKPPAPAPGTNTTEPDWGSPTGKGIRPGINMAFEGAGCTTSFLFQQDWTHYYLATAAHCVAAGSSEQTDGCNAPLADKNRARLDLDNGGTAAATIIYSSWATMQRIGETDPATCAGNDFALLKIDEEDLPHVHPASLHFQAPTGLATAPTSTIYGYGASTLKAGIEEIHPKQGQHLGMANGGWSHHVYLATPGIPGDSGGHIMTSDGKALGVASTIILSPTPASNHYTDIAKAIAYMQDHEGWAPELVTWNNWDPSLT